jgi:RNA:NAD 2'-phosphotransferase (TPT1/KptA family)
MPGLTKLQSHMIRILSEKLIFTSLVKDADKTQYMVMSRDRNAGRGHSVKIDNSSIERVEEFTYLGTMLTDQYSIQDEIKSRLNLGNAYYHSVQNLLSSRLLTKKLKD